MRVFDCGVQRRRRRAKTLRYPTTCARRARLTGSPGSARAALRGRPRAGPRGSNYYTRTRSDSPRLAGRSERALRRRALRRSRPGVRRAADTGRRFQRRPGADHLAVLPEVPARGGGGARADYLSRAQTTRRRARGRGGADARPGKSKVDVSMRAIEDEAPAERKGGEVAVDRQKRIRNSSPVKEQAKGSGSMSRTRGFSISRGATGTNTKNNGGG